MFKIPHFLLVICELRALCTLQGGLDFSEDLEGLCIAFEKPVVSMIIDWE